MSGVFDWGYSVLRQMEIFGSVEFQVEFFDDQEEHSLGIFLQSAHLSQIIESTALLHCVRRGGGWKRDMAEML